MTGLERATPMSQEMTTQNMTRMFAILLAGTIAGLLSSGCAPPSPPNPGDRENGLIIVLPGIDGQPLRNKDVCEALNDAGTEMSVETFNWTIPLLVPINQRDIHRNRRIAAKLAKEIAKYRTDYPRRPVFLIGHSGGSALAVWTAEALPGQRRVDGIILLACSLSPGYDLSKALKRSRGGIVNFRSEHDWLILGLLTTMFGTMDGEHTPAAGMVGFIVPGSGPAADVYENFFDIPWTGTMGRVGHNGGHFGYLTRGFISSHVAPLIAAEHSRKQSGQCRPPERKER